MKLKKWLTILLAAVMLLGLMPMTALAEGGTVTFGENGEYTFQADESGNPLILSEDDWNRLADAVDKGVRFSGITFKLTDDISVSRPIGRQIGRDKTTDRMRFSGTFDGCGHTLTVNLDSSSSWFSYNKGYVAPFAYTAGATILNLHVVGSVTSTAQWASGLVGSTGPGNDEAMASTTPKTCVIDNCQVSVTLTSNYTSSSNYPNHGGFVGIAEGTTTISDSWFDGTIAGSDYRYSGGFIGLNKAASTINYCLFAATISESFRVTGSAEFVHENGGSHTLTHAYYLTHFGEEPQGTRVHTSYEEGDVYDTVTFGGIDYYVINGSNAWASLQAAMAADGTVTLDKDYEAGASDSALVVPAGVTVTLDMNGHTIDRNLFDKLDTGAPTADGCVIKVASGGTLNITDSVGGGIITGGFNAQGGGIRNEGTLNISNVTIKENGATICGGGIYNAAGSALSMTNVTVSGNLAKKNSANGVGVYVSYGSSAAASGKVIIKDNLYVQNTTHTQKNLYLERDSVLTIGGALASNADIHVTLESGSGVVTSGLTNNGGTKNFQSDVSGLNKGLLNGEVIFGYTIKVADGIENGTVIAQAIAAEGDTVALTVTPADTYAVDTVSYNDGSEHTITPAEGAYSFVMPAANVTISATFKKADTEPEFKSHQLILSGQIGMHFYMTIPEGMTDGAMTFDVGGRSAAASGTLQSDGRYKFTCYVNSIEMADTITATYSYTESGEAKTVTDTTSVKEYLEVIIANVDGNAAYTAATPLAKAIYNYGHYAMQALPGGSKHTEMPGTYTGDVTPITSLDGYAISATLDTDVITKASYSLDLDSETAINFYLTTESELTKDNVAVTATGATFEYAVEKVGSRYRVQITGIGAHELGTAFTLTTGNTTISASAMTYVQQCLANPNADTAIKNAAAALYEYYQQAISYSN